MVANRKHVVLVPFTAFGHIIPLLEFGRKVLPFHDVSLAISKHFTHLLIERGFLAKDDPIKLIAIEDGYDPSAFPDPFTNAAFGALIRAMKPAFHNFVESLPDGVAETKIDILVVDNFMTGLISKCVDKGVPFYHFNTAATGISSTFLIVDDDWPTFPDEDERMPGFIAIPGQAEAVQDPFPESFKNLMVPIKYTFKHATGLIANSFRELEGDTVDLLVKHPMVGNLPFYYIGPLVPEEKSAGTDASILNWLEAKETRSVVYVSFGSLAVPSAEQIEELAAALLALDKPFIWSLRDTHHEHLPEEIRKSIATQLDSVDSKYLVVKWAPQKLILGHPATAVYLSHCGWNSTVEAVTYGVPVVGWPMFADQLMNAHSLATKGMAILVEGTGMNPKRVVPAKEIEEALSRVAGWEDDGNSYKAAATQWAEKLAKAVSHGGDSYETFVELMHSWNNV